MNTVNASVKGGDSTPPLPSLDEVAAAGLPVVAHEVFTFKAQEHEGRRRQLHALVLSDSWRWPSR